MSSSAIKPHKIKFSRRNGDKTAFHVEATDMDLDRVDGSSAPREIGVSGSCLNSTGQSERGCTQLPVSSDVLDKRTGEDNTSDSLNFTLILKKVCYKIIIFLGMRYTFLVFIFKNFVIIFIYFSWLMEGKSTWMMWPQRSVLLRSHWHQIL